MALLFCWQSYRSDAHWMTDEAVEGRERKDENNRSFPLKVGLDILLNCAWIRHISRSCSSGRTDRATWVHDETSQESSALHTHPLTTHLSNSLQFDVMSRLVTESPFGCLNWKKKRANCKMMIKVLLNGNLSKHKTQTLKFYSECFSIFYCGKYCGKSLSTDVNCVLWVGIITLNMVEIFYNI